MNLPRLFHTVRWLQPRQIAGQVRYRVARALERPRIRIPEAVAYPGLRWQPRGEFLAPGAQRFEPHALRSGEFRFLNRNERLGRPPDWEASALPTLWRFNLHYFEYLWALPWDDAASLVRDWIARHDGAHGRVGWEPYPVSLRLVNWCAYFLGNQGARSEAEGFAPELWASVQPQADWLARHLEWHLLGNHLLENAAALAFCGACFAGERAASWRRTGNRLLARELEEQVLPDGGHFERSPMYQARVVWLLATLEGTGDPELAGLVAEPLRRSRRALAALCHPDREIALLNDSAFGIANPPAQLACPAAAEGPFALADTGYYGARSGEGHYVVCDAAPVGPDYLLGHAHGDIFSFELSLDGERVIVDAGVHDYEPSELRHYCRSTAAHNTVELEGADQCEFWGVFRVARRGRPHDVVWEPRGDGFSLAGWHDGYERLPARARHERRFRWHPQGVLLVRDRVEARRPVTGCSRLHLHPSCRIAALEGCTARVQYPRGTFTVVFAGPGALSNEPACWCPEFGTRLATRALVWRASGAPLETGFCIARGDGRVRYDLASGADVDGVRQAW